MSISERLDRREEYYKVAVARLRRAIEKGTIGEDTEKVRTWLEQFCIGRGLDICTGDFPIHDDAIGIDGDERKLGAHYNIQGEALTPIASGTMDYVVTNYFDCFPNPLQALLEWNRVLKPGSRLAFSCCNALAYVADGPMGPLGNRHRLSVFTDPTVRQLLARAEYRDISVVLLDKFLMVSAVKK